MAASSPRLQDGAVVGDVHLPPWAADATDFVTKCRAALESEICSRSLHLWIDLIFGYKQRGIAADEESNLFCPQTYEADYNHLPADERRALEMQVPCHATAAWNSHPAHSGRRVPPHEDLVSRTPSQVSEFGQTPLQLFIEAHPPRIAGAATMALVTEEELAARLSNATPAQAVTMAVTPAATAGYLGAAAPEAMPQTACASRQEDGAGSSEGRIWSDGRSASLGPNALLASLKTLRVSQREGGLHAEPVSAVAHAEDGTTLCSTAGPHLKVRLLLSNRCFLPLHLPPRIDTLNTPPPDHTSEPVFTPPVSGTAAAPYTLERVFHMQMHVHRSSTEAVDACCARAVLPSSQSRHASSWQASTSSA